MNYLVPEAILDNIAQTTRAITGYSTFLTVEEIAPLLLDNFVVSTATNTVSFSMTPKRIYCAPFSIQYTTPSGIIITKEDITSCQFTCKRDSKVYIKGFVSLSIKSSSNFEVVESDHKDPAYNFAFTGSVIGELNNGANKAGVTYVKQG